MPRVLSDRRLTVALAARQLLLERRPLGAAHAVRRLAALQAQYSPSPYVALHSRLDGFRISDLEGALTRGTVVKSTLMRGTLHLVAAGDYPAFAAACHPQLSAWMRTANRAASDSEPELKAAIAEYTAVPRTTDEIRAKVHEFSGGTVNDKWLLDYARTMVPMVHVAPSGMWQQHGKFSLVHRPITDDPHGTALLVHRYLAAFGPATREDVAAFTALRYRQLDPALSGLRRFTDPAGRDLYDVPRAPLPAEDVAIPTRLLAKLDAAYLSHADRTRILPAAHHDRVMQERRMLMPYTVDGLIAGHWSYAVDGPAATLDVHPFEAGPLPADLEPEADRMLAFLAPEARTRAVSIC